MEKNDIGLLKYYFSVAGQNNQKETADWIQKVEECLMCAGAGMLSSDKEKKELIFQLNSKKIPEKNIIQYKAKIAPAGNKIILEQIVSDPGEDCAKKLMDWYAAKQNKKLKNGIKYFYDPIHLKGYVLLRNNWKGELIRRIADMNRIIMNDTEIFQLLSTGKVPDSVRDQVRKEYQEYENEIKCSRNAE